MGRLLFFRLITCAVSVASLRVEGTAAAVTWTPVGPVESDDSGKLNVVIADPKNPAILYVAGGAGRGYEVDTSAGIYKSTNGGASWRPIDVGLSDRAVNDVWLDPSNDGILVAATQTGGLYRSVNGGATWVRESTAPLATQLVVGRGGLLAATGIGVLASTNAGATWTVSYSSTVPVNAIASAANVDYAGRADGMMVANAGAGWKAAGTIPGSDAIHGIAIDPLSPGTVYASRNIQAAGGYVTQDLWRTTDSGAAWKSVALPAGTSSGYFRGSQVMAFSAITPHRLYVGGVQQFAYDGATWTPEGYFGDERSINVVPSADKKSEQIYIGSDQGAYYATSIGDASPKSLTTGLEINVVRRVAVGGTRIATTIQDFSAAITENSGASWLFPQPNDFVENGDVAINPANPNYCVISDPDGYNFSSNGCLSFTHYAAPSNAGLAIDAEHPADLYAASANGVFRSTNDGASLLAVGRTWPSTTIDFVRVDPRNDANVFAVDEYAGVVYVSHNGGATWTTATGLPGIYGFIQGLAIDPSSSNTVVVAAETYYGATIYRSGNGGLSFAQLSMPIQSDAHARSPELFFRQARRVVPRGFDPGVYAFVVVGGLAFNPHPPAGADPALVLSTSRGLAISYDLGAQWQNIAGNALATSFEDVAWSNGYLFIATDGQGVLRSSSAVQ
jgi:hypothetical protein